MSVFTRSGAGKLVGAIAVGAVSALLLAGCAGGGGSTTPSESKGPAEDLTLKIGSVLPQTGSLAFLGPPEEAGVQLAVNEVNEAAKGLTIDPATFSVMRNGQAVDLTQKEYDLLLYLIQERGVVFSREDLMQKVWNYDYYGDMRTVDVTVRRLREKIEDDPGKPTRILTRRGAGYYFSE